MDYRKHIINEIKGADIHIAGESFSVRRREPVAFVCDRASMDQGLASRAESEGAELHAGERISSIPQLRSDNIIGADGPLSFVASAFAFPRVRKHVSTLQAEMRFSSEDPHVIEMHISKERFPGFFAWVIPHDEHTAEFGAGVLAPGDAKAAWQNLLRMKGIRGGCGAGGGSEGPKGFVIPLRPRSRTGQRCGRRNVLLAGDAAGQVKSTTGGGVIFGGNCAAIAGRYPTNPIGYELEWRARFGADLAMHAMLHRFLSSRTESQLASLGRRIKKTNLDDYLSRHGHMDRPTRMLNAAALLHLVKNMGGVI
jgi:flavin-dependent dehydrogenase